jgi:hypothetical protein
MVEHQNIYVKIIILIKEIQIVLLQTQIYVALIAFHIMQQETGTVCQFLL